MGVGFQTSYQRMPFERCLTNNSTATAFPNSGAGPIATTTEPVTVDSATPTSNAFVGVCGYEFADLMFFGTDAANETFDVRVVLWRKVQKVGSTATALWVPVHVGDLNLTLGAKVGVASAEVINTEFFCDTVALAAGGDTNRIQVYSHASDGFATARVRSDGFEKIGLYFDIGTAASANAMIAFH